MLFSNYQKRFEFIEKRIVESLEVMDMIMKVGELSWKIR